MFLTYRYFSATKESPTQRHIYRSVNTCKLLKVIYRSNTLGRKETISEVLSIINWLRSHRKFISAMM